MPTVDVQNASTVGLPEAGVRVTKNAHIVGLPMPNEDVHQKHMDS